MESLTTGPDMGAELCVYKGGQVDGTELSDLDLLAAALQEAMDAHRQGVIVGPAVDEIALARAERRARRQDTALAMRTIVAGDAA